MRSDRVRLALCDIRENVELAREFTAGVTLAGFKVDRRTFYAVKCCLEIISEASRRLPEEIKRRHPEIDWPSMAASGNIYRHEYRKVEESWVWDTVEHHLPPLLSAVVAELAETSRQEGDETAS